MSINRLAVDRLKLVTGINMALLAALVVFTAFNLGVGQTGCNRAQAQSGVCQQVDDVVISGATTFENEINVGTTPAPGSSADVIMSAGAGVTPAWTPLGRIKAADEIVNNSTALQNDDDITLTVEANSVYTFHGVLFVDSNTTPDFKFQWSVPAGTTVDGVIIDDVSTVPVWDLFSEAASLQLNGINAQSIYPFWGVFDTSATAGTAVLQWAQQTANATDTRLKAGTWVTITKLG